jgi:S-adenosyl-L-methionine hydrolase (adenosine-forming)
MSAVETGFRPNRIVTLTTDFGTRDAYVGAMKGVLLRIAPDLSLHDVSHEIPPQDVSHGALVLRGACPHFPAGTVHLAVVDPGVGTDRAPIVAVAAGHAFVGPDNGLFGDVLEALGGGVARRVEAGPALAPQLPAETSATFHGRDLFAPVAAALASGRIGFAEIGPEHELLGLARTRARRDASGALRGRVTHHDRFGNAVTDVTADDVADLGPNPRVRLANGTALLLVRTYGDAGAGAVVALIGSEGFLEIAVNGGSARERCPLGVGDEVRVEAAP